MDYKVKFNATMSNSIKGIEISQKYTYFKTFRTANSYILMADIPEKRTLLIKFIIKSVLLEPCL